MRTKALNKMELKKFKANKTEWNLKCAAIKMAKEIENLKKLKYMQKKTIPVNK